MSSNKWMGELTALAELAADDEFLVRDVSEPDEDDETKRGAVSLLDGRYLRVAQNLADLGNAATARTSLGLGSAAVANVGDFATAAQGALADTALQPADVGAMAYVSDAPSDGSTYGRLNGAWAVAGGAVDSVFGRTGAVVAVAGDYLASQITNVPAGGIAAVTVQAAINELDTEKQATDAFLTSIALLGTAADKMLYTTGVDTAAEADLTAYARTLLDDVNAATARATLGLGSMAVVNDAPSDGNQYARQNAAWAVVSGGVTSVFGRVGAVVAAIGDYLASQITNTPAGNITATNVQSAIDELDTEKVAKAGDTMTGDLVGMDFVRTRSGTITRVGGYVSSVALAGGRTLTVTRDGNNYISNVADGARTWTFTRNVDNQITSWVVA